MSWKKGKTAVQKPENTGATIKALWSYLKRRKFLLFAACFMVMLNIVASLAATAYLQPIIDNFLQPAKGTLPVLARVEGLLHGVIVLGCIYAVSVAAAYLQSRLMVHVAQNTIHAIRTDLFDHLQDLSVSYFDSHTNGELMSRFTNDVDTLNEALQNSITTFFSSIITLAGILGIMIWKSWLLTLITLLAVPLMLFATGKVMKASSRYFMAQQESLGVVNGYIEEIMTGQKVVKTFCYEEEAIKEFDQRNTKLQQVATTAQGYAGMMMPLARNINSTIYAVVAMIGGMLTILGFMTVGSLIVFLQLVQSFGRPIMEASNQYNAVVTAFAGAERIFRLMGEKPEKEDEQQGAGQSQQKPKAAKEAQESRLFHLHPGRDREFFWVRNEESIPVKGDVRFFDVDFGYTTEKQILKGISLFAKPGQKIAFVGSTGAGKTTIINLLTRFYEINEGRITIDGIPIRQIARDDLRNAMSVVLQDTHLFTGTIKENIRYGKPDAADEEVYAAAKLASAHSFIKRLPHGYDTVLEGDGSNLSQGQRQLLNIARAAIADAPILILDEATSSVDTRTERQIELGLDRLMKNRTTFVIAHRLSTVRNSNAIMVMEQGQIIERGTHEDLLKLQGRYYQLYTGAVELD